MLGLSKRILATGAKDSGSFQEDSDTATSSLGPCKRILGPCKRILGLCKRIFATGAKDSGSV